MSKSNIDKLIRRSNRPTQFNVPIGTRYLDAFEDYVESLNLEASEVISREINELKNFPPPAFKYPRPTRSQIERENRIAELEKQLSQVKITKRAALEAIFDKALAKYL